MKMVKNMEFQHRSKRKRCLRIGFEYPNYNFLLIITNTHKKPFTLLKNRTCKEKSSLAE